MRKYKIGTFIFVIWFLACTSLKAQHESVPLAPEQYRRPENYKPESFQYPLNEIKERFSEEMMKKSAAVYERVQEVNKQGKWKPTPKSIDLHKAPEWFNDAKFGMFIDWGLWSIAGWAPKKEKGAMYPDWYERRMSEVGIMGDDSTFIKYHEKNWGKDFKRDDFIPLFQARDYHPEKLIRIAKEAGMKYIVPFSKHHSGFCLWPSSFTHRDTGDMGPEKDLVKPFVEHCRKEGLKFGFYFSLEEWEYPVIGDNNQLQIREWGGKIKPYSTELEKKASGKIAVKNYATDYLVPQAVEFIDRYDPDILWYDGGWSTSVYELRSYEIAAYFYNQAEERKEVAVNDRYGLETDGKELRFRRGDFFNQEYGDRKDEVKQTERVWEEDRGISQSFGFNWQDTEDNIPGTGEFIEIFVDIVSRGGNLLLIVNLDGQGALPVVQEKRLKDIGKWLSVNGEGIFGTRKYSIPSEGTIHYTRSKDNQNVYAITNGWPGKCLELKSVIPGKGSEIYLLGVKKPLKWSYDKLKGITTIEIPDRLQNEAKRPCKFAYTFRIETADKS
jgi:alpha-L-fucosidase